MQSRLNRTYIHTYNARVVVFLVCEIELCLWVLRPRNTKLHAYTAIQIIKWDFCLNAGVQCRLLFCVIADSTMLCDVFNEFIKKSRGVDIRNRTSERMKWKQNYGTYRE